MSVDVTLTWTEVRAAACIGVERNVRTIHEGRHRGGGQAAWAGWGDHITGAIAEFAVAKHVGGYPMSGVRPSNKANDLGDVGRLQVRSSARHSYLILQPYDSDDARFVLVTGMPPTLTLVGWFLGCEGKQPCFWHDVGGCVPGVQVHHPAYFVPGPELHPMELL